ncbi:TetR/AcrR family transcriptional regulator [Macrococcoides caseolyticum]|uniref:TetR/AcrR family transcriptional regulator n=1 Tax=Macrococcoides caseolyticum TaxID=69966 RepID=UPI001F1D8073|nr:TetR/AcrR family transcriptional regulator [Macrococcus caseolyticus]MCE4956643.1 TetR/AcrR family transcriptional regulator [Macrococcus caseolyticus]
MDIYKKMNEDTKQNIEGRFIQLIDEKSFKKITIQDISKAANMNRGTFYHHYLDKYDLVEQMMKKLLEDLEQSLNEIDVHRLLDDIEANTSEVYCETIFDFIANHRDVFTVFMTKDLPYHFDFHLKQLLIKQFKTQSISIFNTSEIPEDYIANFAASALMGLIDEWITEGLEASPEVVTSYYLKIIQSLRAL